MAELGKYLDSSHSQHNFLTKTIVRVTAVQVIRQSLIPGRVFRQSVFFLATVSGKYLAVYK